VTSASPSFAEHVCLALIADGSSHGWAVGTELAPAGSIGRIWTLSRPLTYRAVDGLVDKRLVRRREGVGGRGPGRLALTPTAAGRRVVRQWLDTPVEHLRDVRTELLVKLVLRQRAGLENDAFLAAQQQAFTPLIDRLLASDDPDVVDLWRRESARAVLRFLEQLSPAAERTGLTGQITIATETLDLAPRDPVVVVVRPTEITVGGAQLLSE
jgi:DNA-binding PadR family transcriptional regulator